VQSKWRVACVRIPRFPIGAVWQHAIAEGKKSLPRTGANQAAKDEKASSNNHSKAEQLSLVSEDSAKRTPHGITSSLGTRDGGRGTGDRKRHDESPAAPDGTPCPVPHTLLWDDLPIALSDGLRVRAVTVAGARARIRAGMTVTEATSRCADLQVFPWDQVVIDNEIRRATAAFLGASPQVTPVSGAPGMWWIGATGLDAVGGERALAKALLALARRWHPAARVAIADSCVAARAATWETNAKASGTRHQAPVPTTHDSRFTIHEGITMIPPGSDATYLATAPVGLIPMDEAMAEALAALGIRTAGALAVLPSDDVEQRWGRTGLTAWRLARGEDRRRPGLATTEYPRRVSADLVPGVELMEPVLFLVRAALDRLLGGLVADGRAAATLAITLTLDDSRGATANAPAHTITREVRLAHPMARLIPLFESCRALLDRWTLPAPVCGVTVAIVATAPLVGEQGDLLDPSWHDPAAADAAFARLRAELGADAIVVPVVADEHRPERSGAWMALGDTARPEAREPGAEQAPTIHDSRFTFHDSPVPSCSRQLETPEPVEVECADGQPRILWWRGRRMRIEHPSGPERLAGDWWKDPYARDYWRCEDPDGEGTLVLYRDSSSGSAWFVQGWYD
jgi:protein ImuB